MTHNVNMKFKDSVFRMVFRDTEKLLSLYNALNHSHYGNPDELEPLLQDQSIYSSTLLKIPTPRFVVFYNGEGKQPERKLLRLSDSFKVPDDNPELELKVTMLNINPVYNQELMDNCQALMEYMQYVATVRDYAKKSPIEEAVPKAVDECIEKGILKDLLLRNKAEVVAMSIFEYNEEEELKKLRVAERRGGYEDGHKDGRKEGLDEGVIQAKIEDIFVLLQDCGEMSDNLRKKILSQRDKAVLENWFRLAARVDSIEEFVKKMD
ncbi:hypothetical protein NXH76_02605 [Blautia schinkii]|nr:hypothetical protein [Blautia schinkii]